MVTKSQTLSFGVDSQVEQRQGARVPCLLRANPDGPDMPGLQRSLLIDEAALVPGDAGRMEGRK
jgi:hypothetical protein